MEAVGPTGGEPTDRELLEEAATLRWRIQQLETELSERVSKIDRRRAYEQDGAVTVVAWLRNRCRLDRSRANQIVGLARASASFPELREALLRGRISSCEARCVVRGTNLLRRDLERRGMSEATVEERLERLRQKLLDAVEHGTGPEGLRREVDSQRHESAADSMGFDEWIAFQQRELYFHTTFDGMVDVRGTLDPASAATVRTAIDSMSRPTRERDGLTTGQRRADALLQLTRSALDTGTLPNSHGQRPHVSVMVDERTLSSTASTAGKPPAELRGHGASSGDTARMFACDAEVTRLVTGPASEVLDVGRASRSVSAPLRRALAFRDRGCAHPWCDRPVEWCDAHHVVHWAHGGATALDNLVLLCRRHHSEVHLKGTSIEWRQGRPSFEVTRADHDPPGAL